MHCNARLSKWFFRRPSHSFGENMSVLSNIASVPTLLESNSKSFPLFRVLSTQRNTNRREKLQRRGFGRVHACGFKALILNEWRQKGVFLCLSEAIGFQTLGGQFITLYSEMMSLEMTNCLADLLYVKLKLIWNWLSSPRSHKRGHKFCDSAFKLIFRMLYICWK